MNRPATVTVAVFVDIDGAPLPAGTAYISERRGVVSTTFDYHPGYLADRRAFSISPDLALASSKHHVTHLPGVFSDSAPDRWGRNLIDKRRRAQARADGLGPSAVTEVDYLLGVSDLTRQGAVRFALEPEGPFLAADPGVPKLLELPRLLNAADVVATAGDADDVSLAAVKLLLDAGSGSLGGARPKASVRDGGRLLIAKFPRHSDQWDVMAWEKTALDLAEQAGIRVPGRRLVDVDGRHALLLDRFDRTQTGRVGYLSAMTLVAGHDGGSYDYLEVVEALTEHGSSVDADLAELWRRIAFSLVINNTDDHLRNHGFLRDVGGWRLSPAFDINPNPDTRTQHATTVAYAAGPRSDSLQALLRSAADFWLDTGEAGRALDEMLAATQGWRGVAAGNGITEGECDRFADCFDGLRDRAL